MKRFLLLTALSLGTAASAQVGIGTTAPGADLDIIADTIGFRNSSAWDNLWFTIDGSAVRVNASGADDGLIFRVGKNAVGRYGDGQTLKSVMTMKANGSVSIGSVGPDTSAALDINSDSKTLILPRLSTAAMNAVANPVPGMFIFNTDSGKFFGFGNRGISIPAITQQTSDNTLGTFPLGQSFTAVNNAILSGIDIKVALNNVPSTLEVTIRAGVGHTGTILGTAVVPISSATPTLIHVDFPGGVPLTANNQYSISMKGAANPNNGVVIAFAYYNPYSGGSVINYPQWDAVFTIYEVAPAKWHPLD